MSTPFKMKGSPMQRNFKDWLQKKAETIQGTISDISGKVSEGFQTASEKRSKSSKKRNVQLDALSKRLFKRKKKKEEISEAEAKYRKPGYIKNI
jgi:rRNA processing protein Gar1